MWASIYLFLINEERIKKVNEEESTNFIIDRIYIIIVSFLFLLYLCRIYL